MKALFDTTYNTIGKADHVIYLVHDKRTCESNPSCTLEVDSSPEIVEQLLEYHLLPKFAFQEMILLE